MTVCGRVPGCEPHGGVYSKDSVTQARACVYVSASAPGCVSRPRPFLSDFYSSLLCKRAWLRRPHHLHPLLKKQPRPLQSHQHPPPVPLLSARPAAPLGAGGGGGRRRGGDTRQERAHDPVPRAWPRTGTPGSPAEKALHKQMARASLSRKLVRSRSSSLLLGCLADAIMIVSEPLPEPLIAAERVRGPGAPEQMLGTVSSLLGSARPEAPQLQREDRARAEVTGTWR